jgi:hypothetical protein
MERHVDKTLGRRKLEDPMFTRLLAVGVVAGSFYAFSGVGEPVRAAPTGLSATGDVPSAITDVRRRGGGFRGRGFGRHRGFVGRGGFSRHRGFGGRRFYGGHRFAGRRFYGGRRFHRGRHYGWRRHRGRNLFLYGALPFIGYQAYTGGYGYSCGWLWRRYRITGSRYWYRRWASCRYGY